MKQGKSILLWLVAFIFLSLALNGFNPDVQNGSVNTIAFSEFMDNAEENRVQSVTVVGNDIQGTYTDGSKFQTYAPFDPSMIEDLRTLGVKIEARPIDTSESTFWGILISWFPMLLLVGVWIFFMRQANSGNNKMKKWNFFMIQIIKI